MSRAEPKILVVDDDEDSIFVVCSLLSEFQIGKEKLILSTATNGKEALDILEKEKFDLLITDLRMPEIPGDHLIKLLREGNTPNRMVPIILVSGFLDDLVKSKTLNDLPGSLSILEKPFKKSEFEELTQIWISQAAS